MGLPWWLGVKETARNARDLGWIPGSERSPGEGNGNPLQYSCLDDSMGLHRVGYDSSDLAAAATY